MQSAYGLSSICIRASLVAEDPPTVRRIVCSETHFGNSLPPKHQPHENENRPKQKALDMPRDMQVRCEFEVLLPRYL